MHTLDFMFVKNFTSILGLVNSVAECQNQRCKALEKCRVAVKNRAFNAHFSSECLRSVDLLFSGRVSIIFVMFCV